MAEAVMMALVERGMGRQEAHELLRNISMEAYRGDKSLEEALLENEEITRLLSREEISRLVDPYNYIGTAVEQVRNVLEASRRERS
jgi:adenylosuccinate lyase